jgi:hypothetical protein
MDKRSVGELQRLEREVKRPALSPMAGGLNGFDHASC